MKLEEIGFYTLSDARAKTTCATSPMQRCELILTNRCNFSCPYCRRTGGELTPHQAHEALRLWCNDGLKNVRFSGGEPTLWNGLDILVRSAKVCGIERIAISTNGSANRRVYEKLLANGVNDFSISLDACCSSDGDEIAGGVRGSWAEVVENIKYLSTQTYVTVGVVANEQNQDKINDVIGFASDLGVADIRVISAAQRGAHCVALTEVESKFTNKHPILNYRVNNARIGRGVRGIRSSDSHRCSLVIDDSIIADNHHYPCVIYMREGGKPIGQVGPQMRKERLDWSSNHNSHLDPICKQNCLDVCIDYNNRVERYWEDK